MSKVVAVTASAESTFFVRIPDDWEWNRDSVEDAVTKLFMEWVAETAVPDLEKADLALWGRAEKVMVDVDLTEGSREAMKHSRACLREQDETAKVRADALSAWPGLCLKCGGVGVWQVGGSYDELPDWVECEECIGECKCPRCGGMLVVGVTGWSAMHGCEMEASVGEEEFEKFVCGSSPCPKCGFVLMDGGVLPPEFGELGPCQCEVDEMEKSWTRT